MRVYWSFLCLFFSSQILIAQTDSTRTIELENITIQENRFKIPFSESSRDFEIIDHKEIQRNPVQSIPEILSYSPGIDIRQRGPLGVQSDISIRGGTFEQTLVLVNGIKMSDPQTGHHALNLPFNINNIERIEVLKGPAARIFGQNAFNGAVNIITKVPDQKRLELNAYLGDFSLYGGNIALALPEGSYKQYISLARDASEGYRFNTDFSINNVFYQSEFNAANGTFNILAGFTDKKFGANGFYASPDFKDQYEEIKTGLVSAGYQYNNDRWLIAPRVYWRINNDDYLFFRNDPSVYRNDHTTNVIGAEINSSLDNSLGKTGFGIEYRKEMIHGEWTRGGEITPSNLDGFGRDKIGFYAEHKIQLFNKLDLSPGVFVNYYSDFKWNVFPGIDMGYTISPNLRAFANLGTTYRIPTFYDQYYESPAEMGNPDLKPERAFGYEFGLRYLKKGIHTEFNYFNQEAQDLIDWLWVSTSDTTGIWNAQNLSNVVTNGFEVSQHIDFDAFTGSPFIINSLNVSYNYINANLSVLEDVQSRYKIDNLRHQFIFGINHNILPNLYHNLKVRYIQRVENEPFWLVDSRIYYRNSQNLNLFLEATNLTDTQYSEVMTPMPGRWIRLGVKYDINL